MKVKLEKMDIINSMEKNMYHKFQYIPSKINTMNVDKLGDTLVVNSGLQSDTFNTAYGGKISKERVNKVREYYLNHKMPMAWWTGPSSGKNQNIKDDMEAAGFIHDELDAGMYCDLSPINFDEYNLPKNLKIIECNNSRHFTDFGNVLASVFNPVDDCVKTFYSKAHSIPSRERDNLMLFVGYINDKPVSTSGIFITDVAGIYDISTHPKERGRGYGSSMFSFCAFSRVITAPLP